VWVSQGRQAPRVLTGPYCLPRSGVLADPFRVFLPLTIFRALPMSRVRALRRRVRVRWQLHEQRLAMQRKKQAALRYLRLRAAARRLLRVRGDGASRIIITRVRCASSFTHHWTND
jgi:hypothetical protein